MSQGPTKMERELTTKLKQAICRCGNGHSPEEVLTFGINNSHLKIRAEAAQYKRTHLYTADLDNVYIFLSEGVTIRACTSTVQ